MISNSNLNGTIFNLVGEEKFDPTFVEQARQVRLNNSSTQVYMALKEGVEIDESTGDLLFSSTAPLFRTEALLSRDITSRTFSFYYPRTRPNAKKRRHAIVSSTNARYEDWANLNEEEYEASKQDLLETTLDALDKYVPGIRDKVERAEAATPKTFKHYTKHLTGASFGTKFEGLAVSRALPEQIPGLTFISGSLPGPFHVVLLNIEKAGALYNDLPLIIENVLFPQTKMFGFDKHSLKTKVKIVAPWAINSM